MHGHTIVKFIVAKQAKDTHLYKNTKEKLYKTTAAIWYNKVCRDKQLTPNYIIMKVSGNKLQSQKPITAASRYRLNQELKFLYIKKQKLNEKLYRMHLKCAVYGQNNWNIIQTSIGNNLHQRMESHYNNLKKKPDALQEKQKHNNKTRDNNHEQILSKNKKSN